MTPSTPPDSARRLSERNCTPMRRLPMSRVALLSSPLRLIRQCLMTALAMCLTVCMLLSQGRSAHAEEPGKVASSVTLSWADFVKITHFDADRKDKQVLTIPWSEVERLTGVKVDQVGANTTVELPWTEFKALLQWSLQNEAKKLGSEAPQDYVITNSDYSGDLTDDGALLKLKVKVEVLKEKDWKRIPVLPAAVAITKMTLPEGVFLNSNSQVHELLTRKSGSIEATLEFSVAVQKVQGVNQVQFARVIPGSSVLDLTLARENVDVKVNGAQSLVSRTASAKTYVAAAIPNGPPVSISWERALPKVEASPTRLYAETLTLAAVSEGVLVCQEQVTFNILHTAVHELKLQVPDSVSILTVGGPNVQDWRVGDKGELLVVLRGEALGSVALSITYERPGMEQVEIPVIRAKNVEREKGFIGVVAISNLEIDADKVTGARSIDARELPGELVAMTSQPVLLAFRYVEDGFSIPLTVRKHQELGMVVTIVDNALFTAMQLNDGRRITRVVYNVRNNRNQFLRLTMPAGVEIWSAEVGGKAVTPARDEKANVLLPLVRSSSNSDELLSFPVELVYVEAPTTAVTASGSLTVTLPSTDAPVMHEMVNYYLPKEGKYTRLLGGSQFSGTMPEVERFTNLVAGSGARPVQVNAVEQANQMQQQLTARQDAQARATGAQPIRVRLPINGELFRFEKLLVLPGDKMWFTVQYRGWEIAK